MKPAPRKGILKKKTEPEPAGATAPAGKMADSGPQLKWDEGTIAAQDKERGGKMKITEPKTPYAYYDSVSGLEFADRMRMKRRKRRSRPQKPTYGRLAFQCRR